MREEDKCNGSGSVSAVQMFANSSSSSSSTNDQHLDEQRDELSSLFADTCFSSNATEASDNSTLGDKKVNAAVEQHQKQTQVKQMANNGLELRDDHLNNNQQQRFSGTNTPSQEQQEQEDQEERIHQKRADKSVTCTKVEEEDDFHVDMNIDDGQLCDQQSESDCELCCLTPNEEGEEECSGRIGEAIREEQQVDTGQQYSKQFNRLDPNRRSFSSPSVNTLLLASSAASGQHKHSNNHQLSSCGQASNRCLTENYTRQVSVQVRTESAREEKRHKVQVGSTEKLRRRTALGLIGSFGSSHFRLSSNRAQPEVGSSSTTNSSVQTAAATSVKSTSSWRNWFLGRSQAQEVSSSTTISNQDKSSQRASNTRKFLLRNLKPSSCIEQQQQHQVCGFHLDNNNIEAQHPVSSSSGGGDDHQFRLNKEEQEEHVVFNVGHTPTTNNTNTNTDTDDGRSPENNQLANRACEKNYSLDESNDLLTLDTQQVSPEQSLGGCSKKSSQQEDQQNTSEEKAPVVESTTVEDPPPLEKSSTCIVVISGSSSTSTSKSLTADSSSPKESGSRGTTQVVETSSSPEGASKLCDQNSQENRIDDTAIRAEEKPISNKMPTTTISHQKQQQQQLVVPAPTKNSLTFTGNEQQSLVDRLIDSQLEWRQIIREANGSERSLNQLSELQIKRQEVIHELVQTERHHCLTLALMRQVYLSGLKQLNEARSFRESSTILNLLPNSAATSSQQQHSSTSNHHHHHLSSKSISATNSNKSATTTSQPPVTQQTAAAATNQADCSLLQQTHQSDLIDLERLFPALEDLIQAHELFFAHLRLRLVESCQRQQPTSGGHLLGLVGPLGDLLCDQFRLHQPVAATAAAVETNKLLDNNKKKKTADNVQQQQQQQAGNGHKLLQAYAKFCGQHYDSSRYYKHLMQNDKGFKQFIEQCNKQNASCRQRGIPECNLLVTQRLTKYPLLIEQLIKTSKDDLEEEGKLREALKECKALLAELNNQLARKESFERLLDIYAQFSPKSYTIYNRHLKFTKHDLLQHKRLRQLLHSDDQIRIWSATRRKLFQVLCLILNDIVVFLRIESTSPSSSTSSAATSSSSSASTASASTSSSCNNQSLPPPPPPVNCSTPAAAANYQHHLSVVGCSNPNHYHHLQEPAADSNEAHQNQHSPLSTHSLMLASSPNLTSLPAIAAGGGNGHVGTAALAGSNMVSSSSSSFSVKYYFANIDNKSSVISLSKLLVREKAATDQEPRVYLISSSPRQPEMYELAFVSKRHQTSFVEKLKACAEQHNRNSDGHDPLDEEDEEEEEEDLLILHGRHNHLVGCLCDEHDHEEADSEEEEEEEEDDSDHINEIVNDDDSHDAADEDDEEELDADDELNQRFRTPHCSGGKYCRDCRQRPEVETNTDEHLKRTPSTATTVRRRTSGAECELEDEFELDIEQDVVPEPSTSGGEEQASFIYGTPVGCRTREQCAGGIGNGSFIMEESDRKCSTEVCSNEASQSLESEVTRASSSEPEVTTSNESGLSERAKDSLDEAAPSKQKLRANRRRRAQRPRNISNQSSSSSEAAHRQAIQLMNCGPASADSGSIHQHASTNETGSHDEANSKLYEEEFDSGRGHDDSSSAASTSSNSLNSRSTSNSCVQQSAAAAAADTTITNITTKEPLEQQQPVATKSSTFLSTTGSKKDKKGRTCTSGGHKLRAATPGALEKDHQSATTTTGTSKTTNSCSSSTASGSTVASASAAVCHQASKAPSGGCSLMKCSSILSKSGCSFMKQRKLSTVSTMSSQLKLITKLKSNLVEGNRCLHCRGSNRGRTQMTCNHQQQQQPAISGNCCCGCGSNSNNNSQHSTLNKQMRQQMRRSTFIPEQKLEELRDLRIQLDKDKQEWQAKFDKMQEQLLNERRELDLAREKLKQDRQQVANEREQLYRKLDVLKEKGILLSPSHKVIITTPELRIYPPTNNSMASENYTKQNYNYQHHHHHHHQVTGNGNGTNLHQRQPLHPIINQDNHHSSTIQIVNHQSHQQQQQQQHFRYSSSNQTSSSIQNNNVGGNNNNTYFTNITHTAVDQNRGQRPPATSNLFIQNGKVPLHLSEGSAASVAPAQKSSPMSLMSKVSLIGSTGSSLLAERLCGSSKLSSGNVNMESHVI